MSRSAAKWDCTDILSACPIDCLNSIAPRARLGAGFARANWVIGESNALGSNPTSTVPRRAWIGLIEHPQIGPSVIPLRLLMLGSLKGRQIDAGRRVPAS